MLKNPMLRLRVKHFSLGELFPVEIQGSEDTPGSPHPPTRPEIDESKGQSSSQRSNNKTASLDCNSLTLSEPVAL